MRRELSTFRYMLTTLLLLLLLLLASFCCVGHAASVSKSQKTYSALPSHQHKEFRVDFVMDITKLILNIIGKIR